MDINAKYFTDLNIDFKQLLYFVVVVEHMNFSKAAAALYVTQPLLSQRIAALEKAFGCQLLIRSHRGLQLTSAGEVLEKKAREIIALTNDLTFSVRRAASTSQPEGELRIALEHFLPDCILSDAVQRYKNDFPRIVFHLFSQSERYIFRALEKDDTDIGILPAASGRLGPGIEERVVGREVLCFVAAQKLLPDVTLQRFIWLANRFPTIVTKNGCATGQILKVYNQLGIGTDFHFMPTMRDVLMEIECGMGVTLLPERYLPELARRNISCFPLRGISAAEILISAYWKKESRNILIPDFIDALVNVPFEGSQRFFGF